MDPPTLAPDDGTIDGKFVNEAWNALDPGVIIIPPPGIEVPA